MTVSSSRFVRCCQIFCQADPAHCSVNIGPSVLLTELGSEFQGLQAWQRRSTRPPHADIWDGNMLRSAGLQLPAASKCSGVCRQSLNTNTCHPASFDMHGSRMPQPLPSAVDGFAAGQPAPDGLCQQRRLLVVQQRHDSSCNWRMKIATHYRAAQHLMASASGKACSSYNEVTRPCRPARAVRPTCESHTSTSQYESERSQLLVTQRGDHKP